MGWRGVIVMLVMAVLLGIVCVVDARLFRTTGEREEAEKKVFDFEEGALTRFEIRRGEGSFALEKGADSLWYVVEPIRCAADQATARNVPFELRTMRKIRTIATDESTDLATYGLKEPRLEVVFQVTDRPDEVRVGNEDAEGNVYVLVEGRERGVYTVGKGLFEVLNRDLAEFRERRLIPFETYNVESLALARGEWGIHCRKVEDAWWVETATEKDRADDGKIDGILRRIQGLRAEEFIDGVDTETAKAYGLGLGPESPKTCWIQIGLKNDTIPKGAELAEPIDRGGKKRVPARRVPTEESRTILLVPGNALEDFGRDFDEFRSRVALDFSLYEVESFSVRRGEEELAVRKEEGAWKVTSPREIGADEDEVRMLLQALRDLRIEEFVDDRPVDLGPYGLQEGVMEITISTDEGEEGLRIGAAAEGTAHAMRVGRENVFRIGSAGLPAGPGEAFLRVIGRRVLDFSTFDAQTLRIEGREKSQTFRKEDGKWMAGGEESREVAEVVLSLSALQAIRFVADGGDDPAYGLADPSLIVSVDLEEGATRRVSLGNAVEGEGTYARVDGSELVFLANPSLVRDIRKLLEPEDEPPN